MEENTAVIHMTAAEYQKMLREQAGKKTKYHNKYVYIYEDGYVSNEKDLPNHGRMTERVDSVKEYRRGCELRLLERSGTISCLQKQVPLTIEDSFQDSSGKTHRAVTYKADFVYTENGKTVVEDVKGVDKNTGKPQTTEAFRLKWKLLQSRYPERDFRIY